MGNRTRPVAFMEIHTKMPMPSAIPTTTAMVIMR